MWEWSDKLKLGKSSAFVKRDIRSLPLLPHLRQLEIDVVLGDDLPWFDKAVMDCVKRVAKPPSRSEIQAALRKPFPDRKRSWFTDAMNLMEWSDTMCKGAYPSRKVAVPAYDPATVVSIHVTAEELETILIGTDIAKTKKLRPQLESMAAEDKAIELDIHEWSRVLLALCGARAKVGGYFEKLLRELLDGPREPLVHRHRADKDFLVAFVVRKLVGDSVRLVARSGADVLPPHG